MPARAPSDPTADLHGLVELEVTTPWRVVADLHLDPLGDARVDGFVAWLDGLAAPGRVVVLGDLFDVWVGPAQARLAGAAAVVSALRRLVDRGVPVEIVPGNRDFLLDPSFERASGARLHPRGLLARLGALRVLLVHGDELCTLDHAYQRMKRVLRSGPVRWLAPRLPLSLARRAAARLRRASTRAVPRKPAEERSIQRDAVRAAAAHTGADLLVCGHAHEYRDERLDPGPRWIVLDAWGGARDALQLSPERLLVTSHGDGPSCPQPEGTPPRADPS